MTEAETTRVVVAGRFLGRWVGFGLLAVLVALPILAEQAIERARFEDRLGTFPVVVSLSHNGRSTLDTGVVGKLYWDRTGVAGFGASLRSTGPPEAGGTLTSYVAPEFLQANAAFVDDPGDGRATSTARSCATRSLRRLAGHRSWWRAWPAGCSVSFCWADARRSRAQRTASATHHASRAPSAW